MQNNILFFQSISIGGFDNTPGLFELLLTHLDNIELGLFEQQQIIVPNTAIAKWLKDQIAIKYGICANLDCVVLPSPVLDNTYYANHPECLQFNFDQAKYMIYSYLCSTKLEDNVDELNSYIYVEGVLDKLRIYQLATQLHKIFYEYMYLRTEDLIDLSRSKIQNWQKKIIEHLFTQIGAAKTFLDVYKYFMSADLNLMQLPKNLVIFGLNSIYPSQLQLLGRLSNRINIYWYYQTPSYQYYGDLLSDRARAQLEQKLLRYPDLNPDDLALQDGNPLLANLAGQSREFTELLIASDVDISTFAPSVSCKANTILQQIQEDIRSIKYRVEPAYRFGNNQNIYADPIDISNKIVDDAIHDLPQSQTSIKINICHNRMREVQVMFNELLELLNKNPAANLGDILITAPDIDDYAPYITAVFDNEVVGMGKLLYNITGNRKYKDYKILETLKTLLGAPYVLTANYFMQILIQSELRENLAITITDIELVRRWLYDNKTHFGYDERDYVVSGYVDYQIHSFKQFMNNIVLGACISDNVWQSGIPLYAANGHKYVPYDNLDNNQVKLCNKLIILINQLEELNHRFYRDATNYNELTVGEIYTILTSLNNSCLKDKNSINHFELFLGELQVVPQDLVITLPILNMLLDEYIESSTNSFTLNGNISCASMHYVRNIPYKYTYVLGLNFGEYPSGYTPHELSLLAHDWFLADRNYNLEDKQIFLDTILACTEQLYLSYIGRRETDNSEIKPSPLLGLVITTLGQSFSNFTTHGADVADMCYDFKNLLSQQALHPFYNNKQPNYSRLWSMLAQNKDPHLSKVWDFTQTFSIPAATPAKFYQLKIEDMLRVFLYSNSNLYSILGINTSQREVELSDTENLNLTDRGLATHTYKYFEKYLKATLLKEEHEDKSLLHAPQSIEHNDSSMLQEFLITNGVLAYGEMGQAQFNYYYELYGKYIALQGTTKAILSLNYTIDNITLTLDDVVYLDGERIIITDSFANIFTATISSKVEDLPYWLKIRGLFIYLLCFGGAAITVENKAQTVTDVVIRQISTTGDVQDFILKVADIEPTLNSVFSYYLRSLANPILVHKGAIQEYAKLSKAGSHTSLCFAGAKAKYLADYHGLAHIKADRIFGNIAENYFEFMQIVNGVNDIVKIGEILAKLSGMAI